MIEFEDGCNTGETDMGFFVRPGADFAEKRWKARTMELMQFLSGLGDNLVVEPECCFMLDLTLVWGLDLSEPGLEKELCRTSPWTFGLSDSCMPHYREVVLRSRKRNKA